MLRIRRCVLIVLTFLMLIKTFFFMRLFKHLAHLVSILPSENAKGQYLNAFNQFPVTLEEEVVQQMAPLQSGPPMGQKSFAPVMNNLHDATFLNKL